MSLYMVLRIIEGAFTFSYVISKRPDLQKEIEKFLTDQGRIDLIYIQANN